LFFPALVVLEFSPTF